MKVTYPVEAFEVTHFWPEEENPGVPRYGTYHSSGARVVSGHWGPEGILMIGDIRKVLHPGDVVLRGDRGTVRAFTQAEFDAMVESGALTVVDNTPEAPAPVPPEEVHGQEAENVQGEEGKSWESHEGVQERVAPLGVQEGTEGEVAQTSDSHSPEPVGPVEEEKEEGENKV